VVGTVLENIAYGELQPDVERAWAAARLAKADQFIEALPEKMGFRLGQEGLGLSGGERQRVAVARALYRDPPILVFDEMTSSLDRETERHLLQELAEVLKGRTSFIISHRISSLKLCKRILFLEKGELKGFAPLAELREQDESFRRLMTDDEF
jgi:ATP-binding cassette subfamily B protein